MPTLYGDHDCFAHLLLHHFTFSYYSVGTALKTKPRFTSIEIRPHNSEHRSSMSHACWLQVLLGPCCTIAGIEITPAIHKRQLVTLENITQTPAEQSPIPERCDRTLVGHPRGRLEAGEEKHAQPNNSNFTGSEGRREYFLVFSGA
jgi:hypothetical protein